MNQAVIVTDLGFGDSGKGTMTEHYAHRYNAHAIVRFNGGAQAAHKVVLHNGDSHIFSQFGSGTFKPGVKTFLSRFMLFDPISALMESCALDQHLFCDPLSLMYVDHDAMVVTPYQKIGNRLRELSRDSRHGSCGLGIGETMADSITYPNHIVRVKDLNDPSVLKEKLDFFRDLKTKEFSFFEFDNPLAKTELEILHHHDVGRFVEVMTKVAARMNIVNGSYLGELLKTGTVIFEGAQGVLLDEWYGFHPHTTWSTTTQANAITLLREQNYQGKIKKTGVIRAYMTRHGAGPFPTEQPDINLPDSSNTTHDWQQGFRVGWLDTMLLNYALEANGDIDELAITCLDRLQDRKRIPIATSYYDSSIIHFNRPHDLNHQWEVTKRLMKSRPKYQNISQREFIPFVANRLKTKVGVISRGPTLQDKEILIPDTIEPVKVGDLSAV